MDEHEAVILGRGDATPVPHPTTVATNWVAGAILVLGAGAAYLLTQAGPEALAATSRALITTGLAGLVLMAVVGVRRSRTGRESGGWRGGGGGRPPGPVPVAPMDDIDAEFLRMINDDMRAVIGGGSPC